MKGDPNAVPRMPADQWAAQPPAVWRAVEAACWEAWPGKVRYASGTATGSGVPTGWLTRERGEKAEALDVPVGRLFTACALARRAGV